MVHTAQAVNDMLLQASQRLGSRGDAKADRHPASLFMLVLDIALKCLEDPKLTSSQKQLALHLVKHWAPRLPAVLRTDPSELREVDEKEMEAKDHPMPRVVQGLGFVPQSKGDVTMGLVEFLQLLHVGLLQAQPTHQLVD